jgi:hypothetical protein
LIVGEPTGLTGKYYLNSANAIDFAVGEYGAFGRDGLGVHVDYLWHPWPIASSPPIGFYVGIGGRVFSHDRGDRFDDHTHVAVRVPFGIQVSLRRTQVPIEIFLEIVPMIDFETDDRRDDDDDVDFDIDAAAGIRFHF